MSWIQWMAWGIVFMFYISCLLTVCGLTFQKGYTVLGIAGIFLPFLWLIGAILPAKPGSNFDVAARTAAQQQVQTYSQ